MNLSVSEYGALVRSAARGSSVSWSIASSIADAAKCLARSGIDPTEDLIFLFSRYASHGAGQFAPSSSGINGSVDGQGLCPIITGHYLADQHDFTHPTPLGNTEPVLAPKLFCAIVALGYAGSNALIVQGSDFNAIIHENALLSVEADNQTATQLRIETAKRDYSAPNALHRLDVSIEAYDRLQDFAQASYAPATEESRRLGAGSSLNDND